MATAVFVDTNVLVYAADSSEPQKHQRAVDVLGELDPLRTFLSAQVLAEYANVLARGGLGETRSGSTLEEVRRFSSVWHVLPVEAETVIAALEAKRRFGLAYYDAQIWAAAVLGGAQVVLSEDFQPGSSLGGVRFVDPFADDFDITRI
jgi:predicted nucleic acid-binding protein